MSGTYKYDFNTTITALEGCIGEKNHSTNNSMLAMETLFKNAEVYSVSLDDYKAFMRGQNRGEWAKNGIEGLHARPIDFPVDDTASSQETYLQRLCRNDRNKEIGRLLIRKDENSPVYVMSYQKKGTDSFFSISEEPLIPSAAEYAREVEKQQKPLPPEPNIFQKIGHFFSTLFGGEGNAAVNRYNRALDENEAILYYGMRDAGYRVEKSEAVTRFEKAAERERAVEIPQKNEDNIVIPGHEKKSQDQVMEERKRKFMEDLKKLYPEEKDADFINEMSDALYNGSPEVQTYILALKQNPQAPDPKKKDSLDALEQYSRTHMQPGALMQMLEQNAKPVEQQPQQPQVGPQQVVPKGSQIITESTEILK